MDVRIDKRGWKEFPAEAVIVGAFEPSPDGLLAELNKLLEGAVTPIIRKKEFTGELKKHRLVSTLGKLPAENVFLVGCGRREKFDTEVLRRVSGEAARVLREHGIKHVATTLHLLPVKGATMKEKARAVTEGLILGAYQFTKYVTENKEKIRELKSITILEADKSVEEGARTGKIVANAQCWARDLVNEPPTVLTPTKMSEEALKLKKLGVRVIVFDKKQIQKIGLTALLAVSAGSSEEPRFIIMEWKKRKGQPLVFCGKGITFDSGGLDLKPARAMSDMKTDMAGGAAVIAAMRAIAELNLPVSVVGIVPATENMPGNRAYKPGDVIRAYNGKTIDIGNTDAEGRVVLADALSYAVKHYKPKAIVDVATLTGACVVALGRVAGGVMGSDSSLVNKLRLASRACGEKIWEFPLWDDYEELVKSEIADVLNVPKRNAEAGVIAGGLLLQKFVGSAPWAHLDIAGPARMVDKKFYWDKGGSGFGVRLLVEFAKNTR